MALVYLAADPIEAEIVRGLFAAERIDCDIFGAMLWGGRGEIAADPYPRVVLRDARDELRARELLREYRDGGRLQPAWTCRCGETVPGNFAACWACSEVPD